MQMNLTDKQRAVLESLNTSGAALIPIIHFGKLKAEGLVDRAEVQTKGRGFVGAQITAEGRSVLTQ